MARDTPKIRKARNLAEPADETEADMKVSKPAKYPVNGKKKVNPASETGRALGKNRLPHG